ncbi:MAG: MFS transporter [Candidatus Cloacimonadaceae bacterium]|jgi:UMF1 family MFS transporter|nr:MFS transporter [Candidatus Cloacimonadota bacterium]MDY0128168.1 MFS transporter [Candidatus Cloacimonadaceae bacterium]MCB5254783.1 MFS transporter [Candidatus Cloacimonadota bacterium]MCK9178482.1 MFS transporter [Candidatus Cloacimonadota bacterium]MCK9243040.1 MFS transporter [Candidatus Cloacimonadota bacterium]
MKLNKQIFGWMMYDFANSAFTTIIVTVVYSVYFMNVVVGGDPGYREMLWGRAIGISMTLVALTAPILGAVADFSRSKKKFLFINCYLTVIFTALLYFVGPGQISRGMIFFIIANYGFNSANVFYDAFLPEITTPEDMGKVSGFGWALGYLGGMLALVLSLILIQYDVRWVFPMISVHFFVFSLFTFFWLGEVRLPSKRTNYFKTAYRRVYSSIKNMRSYPELLKFMLSYFIYNDGITTVIVFAAIYGITRFGMNTQDMLIYFILAQVTSIIGSALFGWLTDKKGVKLSLSISLLIWISVVVWAFFCRSAFEYYFVGLLAGMAIGSSQSNSRTMLSMLTPNNRQAEFFGFYTLTGRLSSIIGPILYGWIAHVSGDIRYSILSLLLFFLAGWIALQFVNPVKGMMDAGKTTLNLS